MRQEEAAAFLQSGLDIDHGAGAAVRERWEPGVGVHGGPRSCSLTAESLARLQRIPRSEAEARICISHQISRI